MRNFLKGLWQDESGASAAEYALLLAVVAGVIAVGAGLLGSAINVEIREACGAVSGTNVACP